MNAQMQGTIDRRRVEQLDRYMSSVTTEIWGISGNCLNPWLCEGDAIWIDRTIAEPVDGDLVVVSLRYRKSLGFIGMAAPSVRRDSMKQLRIIDGQYWLASADGWIEWPTDAKLVGVVIAWHRVGDDRPAMDTMNFDEFA